MYPAMIRVGSSSFSLWDYVLLFSRPMLPNEHLSFILGKTLKNTDHPVVSSSVGVFVNAKIQNGAVGEMKTRHRCFSVARLAEKWKRPSQVVVVDSLLTHSEL
jgi:hypothetical protein